MAGRGRTKGSVNKATADLVALLREDAKAHGEEGWHPVVYMQRIAMGVAEHEGEDRSTLSDRITCARAVAEYLAPKRRPVDDSGDAREHHIHHIAASDAKL